MMGSLLDKHLEEAARKPWPVSEPTYAPQKKVWSGERRVNLFFMGTLLPLWCLLFPLISAGGPRPYLRVLAAASRSDMWWAAISISVVLAAVLPIVLSSVCMAVCCLWPDKNHDRWVFNGMLVGGLIWTLIFIVLLGVTFFLLLIPTALVVGGILLVTHLGTCVLKSQYRFSIASILKITLWSAMGIALIPFIPHEYWNAFLMLVRTGSLLVVATPGAASYAFWAATWEANDFDHRVNRERSV